MKSHSPHFWPCKGARLDRCKLYRLGCFSHWWHNEVVIWQKKSLTCGVKDTLVKAWKVTSFVEPTPAWRHCALAGRETESIGVFLHLVRQRDWGHEHREYADGWGGWGDWGAWGEWGDWGAHGGHGSKQQGWVLSTNLISMLGMLCCPACKWPVATWDLRTSSSSKSTAEEQGMETGTLWAHGAHASKV